MSLDPYAALGVDRTATTEEVNAAFRKASKTAHPDAAGDPEDWSKIGTAVAVLRDPRRRKLFDETGQVDDAPDTTVAAARQIIDNFIGTAVDKFLTTAEEDPRHRELFRELIAQMLTGIQQAEDSIRRGHMTKRYVEDLAGRFTGDDELKIVERLFENRQRAIDAELERLDDAIAARKKVIEIASLYEIDTSAERDLIVPVIPDQPQ